MSESDIKRFKEIQETEELERLTQRFNRLLLNYKETAPAIIIRNELRSIKETCDNLLRLNDADKIEIGR